MQAALTQSPHIKQAWRYNAGVSYLKPAQAPTVLPEPNMPVTNFCRAVTTQCRFVYPTPSKGAGPTATK